VLPTTVEIESRFNCCYGSSRGAASSAGTHTWGFAAEVSINLASRKARRCICSLAGDSSSVQQPPKNSRSVSIETSEDISRVNKVLC
jgi:hypothetical protein